MITSAVPASSTEQRNADELLEQLFGGGEGGRRDPYPLYRELHSLGPVHRSELDGNWYVRGYDPTRQALLDPRMGKARRLPWRYGMDQGQLERTYKLRLPSMLFYNGADHKRMRAPGRSTFLPSRMEQFRARITEVVDQRLDEAADQGAADVVSDIALRLPVTIIGDVVGVPPGDRAEFPPLVYDFFDSLRSTASPDQMDKGEAAINRLRAYFSDLIAERRVRPAGDLVSHFVSIEGDGAALSDEEILANINLIFVAGFVTTANLVANGLLALFRHPDQMASLWPDRDPDRLANALEEMLRYDSPVQQVSHLTLEDMEVGGHRIPAQENVIFLLAAANHDPDHFSEPDRFIVDRPDAGAHVSFAWGAHHCLGAPLARLEGQVVFSRLRERFSQLELLDYDPPRRPDPLFRALTSLPVRFVPR